jgi:hypothetical protein
MGAGLHMHGSQLCEFQAPPLRQPCCLLLPLATLGLGFHTLTNIIMPPLVSFNSLSLSLPRPAGLVKISYRHR